MQNKWGKLSADWKQVREIIIFGFGNMTSQYIEQVMRDVKVLFLIDNNPKYKGTTYKGIPIYSYEEAEGLIGKTKIVLSAETIALNNMKQELTRCGYKENVDFTSLERFVCEWGYKHLEKARLFEVHTAVTTRCSFNCKKCNMFMPYYKERFSYSLEELQRNIDVLFSHIDYIFKYQIVGGEPFLNVDLEKYLEYIWAHYADRIGRVRIITNGSIMPRKELLKALQRPNCEVCVSDYSASINYGERLENVINCLKENNINFSVMPSLKWRDFGFPEKPCNYMGEEIREHMLTCGTFWHGLADEKIFYCNTAWSAQKCNLFQVSEDDFVDLSILEQSEESKIRIMELCLGDMKKGYNSLCKFCGGCGEDNVSFIQAGEQL